MSDFNIPLLDPWLVFLSDEPMLRILQIAMLVCGGLVVFLVFYTTRDILLRTRSFWYMLISIVLVAALPLFGFLIYLLIRPARTIREREVEEMLMQLTGRKSHQAEKKERKEKKKSEKSVAKKEKNEHSTD